MVTHHPTTHEPSVLVKIRKKIIECRPELYVVHYPLDLIPFAFAKNLEVQVAIKDRKGEMWQLGMTFQKNQVFHFPCIWAHLGIKVLTAL